MSEHKATVKWARDGADFGYKNYSRNHDWIFENGVELLASAAPAYLGDPNRVDPESAFVAALSSCHMLTFLALASNKGFVVDSYEDTAVGFLEKDANGKLAVTRVDLRPRIAFSGEAQPTQADLNWLHDKAHRECFHRQLRDDQDQCHCRGIAIPARPSRRPTPCPCLVCRCRGDVDRVRPTLAGRPIVRRSSRRAW